MAWGRHISGSDQWTGASPAMLATGWVSARVVSVVCRNNQIHAVGSTAQIGRQYIVDTLWWIQFEVIHDTDEVIAAGIFAYTRVMQFFLDYR